MSTIAEVRAKHLNLAQVLKDHVGIRKIVEDLYPDQAHFIYELLQNAQDTGATSVAFRLVRGGLTFEHDGRPFSPGDIFAITDIGESNKVDEDKIGRFGVGFKAVFAYSETPTIHSPTFSFRIEDLVLPTEVSPLEDLQGLTRFMFPFNNPKKDPLTAYEEVAVGLSELSEMALLFLPSLSSISWSVEGGVNGELLRISHSAEHMEILRQSSDGGAVGSHFLRFDAPVAGLGQQNVSVAFPLGFVGEATQYEPGKPLAGQLRVVAANPGQVAVFFPAEKETSGLRFHLHAPFVPELSRASIKETPANIPLFEQLAQLSAGSLHRIKEMGLLSADFLSVLPNPLDPIPPRYQSIRTAITEAMNREPLTPTQTRGHAPARTLLQAKASLKDLLGSDDLALLAGHDDDPPAWAASAAQKNSNADRFLTGLAIRDWDVDEFVDRLQVLDPDDWRHPDEELRGWLAAKPAEWHQQLYALLHRELVADGDVHRVVDLELVRLRDGRYRRGAGSYFPSGLDDDDGFPRVDASVYNAGRSKPQQAAARKLLEELGTRDVGEAELVEALLKDRYAQTSHRPRVGDMRRFVALVETDPTKATLFSPYFIFEDENGSWRRPRDCFLDSPLRETGLRAYHARAAGKGGPVGLAGRYPDSGVSLPRLLKFAEATGVITALRVVEGSCVLNPSWSYLASVGGGRSEFHKDQDYSFAGFEAATATPDMRVSALVWRTMESFTQYTKGLQATYQMNQRRGAHYASSKLVHQLRAAAWVPQSDGRFVVPAEARADLLPAGFPYDPGKRWLKAIGFGEALAKRSEEAKQKQSIAKQLGFQDGTALEDAQWFAGLDPAERLVFKQQVENRRSFSLPESQPGNPDRRAERVLAMAAEAPERVTEERTRSVSAGLQAVKQEAEQYLRRQYTNADGVMICQVCQGPLPFRLPDGRHYVEKVEFIAEVDRRHHQNYLALCPNHAAMIQHAHGSEDLVREMLLDCDTDTLDIVLAETDASIYFTRTHLLDLKAVIASENRPSS
ncbi:MAG: hypothetical protein B7Y45_10310 [Sphingomonas sp. 28-66-16]|nr:MAG: hypothetical protein B7Y45_10310 [Sphingomonas sp. 28-66-16]